MRRILGQLFLLFFLILQTSREARRYIERCNRAERQRRRNEEHRKVHQIVDLARSHDPRLLAAEKAAREAKEARKRERLEAIQKRRAEEEAVSAVLLKLFQ